MRYAGERMRAESGTYGKQRQGRFQAPSGRGQYNGGVQQPAAMVQMPEFTAQSAGVNAQARNFSNPQMQMPNFSMGQFRAQSRI